MVSQRRHYPFTVYLWTVLCAAGLASMSIGIADGWVLIAAGVAAITVALTRLQVILHRRRAAVAPRTLPLNRPPSVRRRP